MMIQVLLALLMLFGSIYLGLQLRSDPGAVMLNFNHWSIETSLLIAVLALLILFFIFHFLLLFLSKLRRMPSYFSEWRQKRRIKKAQSQTQKGFIEFSEGYWQEAQDHLMKALPNAETPLFNYLTAARAAQEIGDPALRDQCLRLAQQSVPDGKIAVELTQAQLQLANQQWEQALATLIHLQDLAPAHPYVLKLLMQLYQEVRDWPQLIQLLPDLKRNEVVTGENFNRLQKETYYQALKDLSKYGDETAVQKLIEQMPRKLAQDPEILCNQVCFLIQKENHKEAEKKLRHALSKSYEETLMKIYGKVAANTQQQLAFAETFIKKQPHSAALYLCLGQLSMRAQLWGKAKHYLEKCILLEPNLKSYAELGKLYERLEEPEQALESYRQGLILALGEAEEDKKT